MLRCCSLCIHIACGTDPLDTISSKSVEMYNIYNRYTDSLDTISSKSVAIYNNTIGYNKHLQASGFGFHLNKFNNTIFEHIFL